MGKFRVVWRMLKPLLQGVSPAPKQGPQNAVRMMAPASIRSDTAPFFTRSENTGWEEGYTDRENSSQPQFFPFKAAAASIIFE